MRYTYNAYLIFETHNYISKFSERESTPRFYFTDNGILNLFLINKDPILLENMVAVHLKRKYGDQLYYIKSAKTGIDVDFFIPDKEEAVQVTYTLNEANEKREIGSLVKLAGDATVSVKRCTVVIMEDDEGTIQISGIEIEAFPLYRFLLT